MILRRMGNKSKICDKIQVYFPKHKIYIEPFFGAGGMFFNKPLANYNFLNDFDSDVSNLFNVIVNRKDDFIDIFTKMPMHMDLLKKWKKTKEDDEILKACRFVFLSNFTYLGAGTTMAYGTENPKKIVLKNLDATFNKIQDCQFSNLDFRECLNVLRDKNKEDSFIYCDPPYLGTNDNYSNSFTEKDSADLFYMLYHSGIKFAMSEFDSDFILIQADIYKLNVVYIGERQNLKNRRNEVLITNYINEQTLF